MPRRVEVTWVKSAAADNFISQKWVYRETDIAGVGTSGELRDAKT